MEVIKMLERNINSEIKENWLKNYKYSTGRGFTEEEEKEVEKINNLFEIKLLNEKYRPKLSINRILGKEYWKNGNRKKNREGEVMIGKLLEEYFINGYAIEVALLNYKTIIEKRISYFIKLNSIIDIIKFGILYYSSMRVILKDEINGLIEDYARLTVIETENKILADIIDSDWDELCGDVRKQEEEILEREKVKKENIKKGIIKYNRKLINEERRNWNRTKNTSEVTSVLKTINKLQKEGKWEGFKRKVEERKKQKELENKKRK